MSETLVVAGVCQNCGPISGDALAFNFPAPAECLDCNIELDKAGVVEKRKLKN